MSVLKSEKVIELLQSNTANVKVFPAGQKDPWLVPADQAFLLAKSEKYQGIGSNRKVRYLREIVVEQRPFPIDLSWWDDRAVLRYWPDQRTLGGRGVHQIDRGKLVRLRLVAKEERMTLGRILQDL